MQPVRQPRVTKVVLAVLQGSSASVDGVSRVVVLRELVADRAIACPLLHPCSLSEVKSVAWLACRRQSALACFGQLGVYVYPARALRSQQLRIAVGAVLGQQGEDHRIQHQTRQALQAHSHSCLLRCTASRCTQLIARCACLECQLS